MIFIWNGKIKRCFCIYKNDLRDTRIKKVHRGKMLKNTLEIMPDSHGLFKNYVKRQTFVWAECLGKQYSKLAWDSLRNSFCMENFHEHHLVVSAVCDDCLNSPWCKRGYTEEPVKFSSAVPVLGLSCILSGLCLRGRKRFLGAVSSLHLQVELKQNGTEDPSYKAPYSL